MAKTAHQELGTLGESLVVKTCFCPRCKREKTLRLLPPNFKCADVICDFCGYLAQVKATNVRDIDKLPDAILGAAWGPQQERMVAGIYFSLFLVLVSGKKKAIYYLPSDFQHPKIFKCRKPLSENARRAGWQGFMYDLKSIKHMIIRLI
jgi:type II restriction enzyme